MIEDWDRRIHIDNKYITPNKNSRAIIRSLDHTKLASKYLIQLGTSFNDSFKILFGISSYGGHLTDRSDLNIELEGNVAESFNNLDNFIKETVVARKQDFFDDPKSDELIRETYYGCVKQDREQKYNPNLKTKITLGNSDEMNNMTTKVMEYVASGEKSCEGVLVSSNSHIPVKNNDSIRELVCPKSQCMAMIQIQSLWFKNDAWGITLETRLLLIFPQPKEISFFMPTIENSLVTPTNTPNTSNTVFDNVNEADLQEMDQALMAS